MDDSIQELLARRDYAKAVPLLEQEIVKYPTNFRLRLQLADALAGLGRNSDAIPHYEETIRHYEATGLIVQAIGVRKRLEKAQESAPRAEPEAPKTARKAPESPLFERLTKEELKAVTGRMKLEQFQEGDIIITEGQEGSSMYVILGGEVKVFTRSRSGENLHLATLGGGDFFGEISILTGRPRTATITASTKADLLRLDRNALDDLSQSMPHIREVLEEFYEKRAKHTVEAMIESMKGAK